MSTKVQLPAAWRISWGSAAAEGALAIDRRAVATHGESTSMAFWQERLRPWKRAGFPLGEVEIRLPEFPALDEAWTLFLWAASEAGIELSPEWEAMCHYAADVRQGLWLDRVRPEHAVQAVYLAIAQEHLAKKDPDRQRFLREAFGLFGHVADKLAAGSKLLDDDIVAGVPAFERYVRLLAADEKLYQEDLARARRLWAEMPASRVSGGGAARRLPLLAIQHPAARQFKMWARVDPKAPEGRGYPLLLIELEGDKMVLSADPTSRATVGWLAPMLTALEIEARGAGADRTSAAWYDGKDHGGTLAAAPDDGTRIGFEGVLAALRGELRLSPVRDANPRGSRMIVRVSVAAAFALIAGAGIVRALRETSKETPVAVAPPPTASAVAAVTPAKLDGDDAHPERRSGAKGDPLPPSDVVRLLDSADGPRSMEHYALIAGVCSYTGDRTLHAPCRDARAVRDALIKDYGYKRENILFLIDDKPEGGEKIDGQPTAEGLKLAIEKFRAKFGDHEDSSFLLFYSGHGGYIKGAQKDYGILQPSSFFKLTDQPYEHRGWDMHQMIDDIKKGVPSKHIMLMLDCCYAGWAGAKGDDELEAHVGSLWKERAEVVLSAGAKGQRAWEDEPEQRAWVWDGHSAMTAFLLEGLKKGEGGFAAADKNKDHVVTDEELAAFVKEKVPSSVSHYKQKAQQTPQFFRLDQDRTKSGQFLFVPTK